jgi:hypothetical protein
MEVLQPEWFMALSLWIRLLQLAITVVNSGAVVADKFASIAK